MVIAEISRLSVAPAVSTIRFRVAAPINNSRNFFALNKQKQKWSSLAKSPSRQGQLLSILKHPCLFGQCLRRFASSANKGETDPYRLLGVDRHASADEIKKAYKEKALKWHPDRHPNEKRKEAEARFGAIANAYETLSDPAKKQLFDQGGQAGGFPGGLGGFQQGGFQQGGFHSQADAERLFREVFQGQSVDDIFRELFGGGSASRGQQALQVGTEVQVLSDRQSVLAACRKCGIDNTNDDLRVRCLGKHGRIIKTDSRDQSVKIKVEDVGDVWLGAAGVRPVGGPGSPGNAQFFEGFGGSFGGFGGEGLSPGGVVQMRQEIVTKPNGQRVVRVTRVVRGSDNSLREEVSESPLQ